MKAEIKSAIRDLYLILQYPKPQKVLFDHLPKCGGTTVWKYLTSHYRHRKIYPITTGDPQYSVEAFKLLPEVTRHSYDLVLGHLDNEMVDYVHPDSITLTILRDPVERIISHYYYVRREVNNYLHDIVTRNNMTLEEYVTSGISGELRNWYVSHFLGMPFSEAESRPEWSVAEAYTFVKERYQVIGFLDDLETAMNNLGSKAGYRNRYENTYLNKASNRPGKDEIEPTVLEAIRQVNYLDVELYGRLKNDYENGKLDHTGLLE
jgi:hypothetical protein